MRTGVCGRFGAKERAFARLGGEKQPPSYPAGLPGTVVALLNEVFVSAIRSPDVDELIRSEGAEPRPTTQQELGRLIAADTARWTAVAKAAKITAED